MNDEIDAMKQHNTWSLVPKTVSMNVIGSKWVYKVKLKVDGKVECLKARLVAKGYHQLLRVDFNET